MATYVFSRIQETTTSTGTGQITLAGATPRLEPFAQAVGEGNLVPYLIIHRNGTEWEAGIATLLLRSTRLTRTTIFASSNANAAVDLSAGTKDVWLSMPGDLIPVLTAAARTFTAVQSAQTPSTAGSGGSGGIVARITPNPTNDTSNPPFNFAGGSFDNSASSRKNYVVRMGHNIEWGGQPEDTDFPALADEWEGYYEISTGVFVFERHIANVLTNGTVRRPFSALVRQDGTNTDILFNTDTLSVLDRTAGYQAFKFTVGAASGSFEAKSGSSFIKSANNETFIRQINAAGNSYVSLIYLNASDQAALTTLATVTMGDAQNIVLNTSTGTKIGTATGQKLGFWNATPVVQQVLATGAGATVDNVISLLQTLGLCRQS